MDFFVVTADLLIPHRRSRSEVAWPMSWWHTLVLLVLLFVSQAWCDKRQPHVRCTQHMPRDLRPSSAFLCAAGTVCKLAMAWSRECIALACTCIVGPRLLGGFRVA